MQIVENELFEYTIRAKEILKRTAQDIIDLSQIAHDVREKIGYKDYVSWVKNDWDYRKGRVKDS